MQIIFDDNGLHKRLAPFTLTRPVAEIRFGILTIRETWERLFAKHFELVSIAYDTADYLNAKFAKPDLALPSIKVAGNIKPTAELVEQLCALEENTALYVNNIKIGSKGTASNNHIDGSGKLELIEDPWHIFQRNGAAIQIDYDLITHGRTSAVLSASNRTSGIENIFIEAGAKVEHAILNGDAGPIYIAATAEIMEGSIIRGPFALNDAAVIKMGAKIYGPTTIGPHCKVGGEVTNSVFQAYSNKGHDGFMGNSVVGEWCNFGADTNTSNLKNNYSNVKIHSYETSQSELRDVLFCGVLMGDHSKTGINTMFNTATVVGVSSNVFGAGFPNKYIPSFSWGAVETTVPFNLEKAFQVAKNMMSRRHIELTDADKSILTYIHTELA